MFVKKKKKQTTILKDLNYDKCKNEQEKRD